jgi:S1-C subfamily serine protease
VSRKGWLILGASVFAALAVVLVSIFFLLRGPWGYTTTPLGGPVVIVKGGGKPPRHGFLGIEFPDPPSEPLTVKSVITGSGAADAGLRPGDVILSIGPTEKPDWPALQRVTQASAPGDELVMKIARGSDEIEVRVRLMSFAELSMLSERERSDKTAP